MYYYHYRYVHTFKNEFHTSEVRVAPVKIHPVCKDSEAEKRVTAQTAVSECNGNSHMNDSAKMYTSLVEAEEVTCRLETMLCP